MMFAKDQDSRDVVINAQATIAMVDITGGERRRRAVGPDGTQPTNRPLACHLPAPLP